MPSVLVVVSAADHWTLRDGTRHPTGFWAEELVEPHRIFTAAGFDITLATPAGVAPTVDRLSLGLAGGLPRKRRALHDYLAAHAEQLAHPFALADVDPDAYDVVLYPGGHGPMEDLAADPASGALLRKRLASGKPLGLLCHGPAAALAAENPDGSWPFAGYRMTALSNREERLNRFARKASWLLQDRLVDNGAQFVSGLPLRPFVVTDRNLYTGQNPASSVKLARTLLAAVNSPALNVSVSRTINASPDAVYARISDVTTMGEHSPETHRAKWINPGEKFKGYNQIGPFYRWGMVATVTEATPGAAFAFRTGWPSLSSWRYELTPVNGGTLVTETVTKDDPQLAPVRWIQSAVGVDDRAAHLKAGMHTTLERLAARLERTAD